jgi:N-acetylglucosamine-6-phosphate deacetylase
MNNRLIITEAKIINPWGKMIDNKDILIENGKIKNLLPHNKTKNINGAQILNAGGHLAAPGFIDTHLHGAKGYTFMEAGQQEYVEMLNFFLSTGVTGLLPTTLTMPVKKYKTTLKQMVANVDKLPADLQELILGFHVEGPFFNTAKKGAQSSEAIISTGSVEIMKDLLAAAGGKAKIVSLAPELDGIFPVIEHLLTENVLPSGGHTNASYQEVEQAYQLGLNHLTHTFNGMKGFHHREPGVVGAAFLLEEMFCELTLDGLHVAPEAARLLKQIKSCNKIILETDSSGFAGVPPGTYQRADGQEVKVDETSVRLTKSGSIAGSILTMDQAAKNARQYLDCSLQEIVKMASYNPAKILGIDDSKGSISAGKDADIIIMDDQFNIMLTMAQGQILYKEGLK